MLAHEKIGPPEVDADLDRAACEVLRPLMFEDRQKDQSVSEIEVARNPTHRAEDVRA
jgi:hypothetical protein